MLAGDIGKAAEEMSKELQQRLGPSRGRRRTTSAAIYEAAGFGQAAIEVVVDTSTAEW